MPRAPTPVKRYHEALIQTMRDIGLHQKWFTSPLNLGGVTGPGGGSGIPIGGLIGQLIQSKVSYDTTEASSLTVPPSGQSLVHNLNRIRYWLDNKSSKVVVLDDAVEIASGVRVLDFTGASVTVTLADGYSDRVTIAISGVGGEGGSGVLVAVSENDTTPNYLENKLTAGSSKIAVTTANEGANEERQVDLGTVNIADLNNVTITSVGNDELLGYDSGGWLNRTLTEAGVSAVGHSHTETDVTDLAHEITVQEDDVETASDVTTLNFEGAVTTLDEGSGKVTVTVSGVSGSGIAGIDIEEAGTPKVTDATILNFVSGATVVDAGGGQADITVSGGGGGGAADFTVWMPEAPPASPSAYDDEFENSSVAGKWTEYDVSDTMTPNEAEYGFYMTGGTINDVQGIWQDVPDQDFVIYTYVAGFNNEDGDDVAGLLLLEDSTDLPNSDCYIYGIFRGGSLGLRSVYLSDYNSWVDTRVNRTGGPGSWDPGYWLALRQVGSQWYPSYSTDGYHWFGLDDHVEDFTVDAVGLAVRRNNVGDVQNKFIFRCFRYSTNAAVTDVMYGDRVNMWRA